MKRAAILLALVLLSACGRRESLRPVTGENLPVKPATAAHVPTPDQLLLSTQEAHPQRSDEPLVKSQERPNDQFDISPN